MRPICFAAVMWVSCTGDIRLPGGPGAGLDGPTPTDPVDPVLGTPYALPVCDPAAAPPATELRRLTRDELTRTLGDLLGSSVDLGALLVQLPGDDLSRGAESFDNQYSGLHAQVLIEVAVTASTQLTSTAAKRDAFVRAHASTSCSATALDATCARELIRNFGKRAWRRPLTTAEGDWLYTAYQTGIDATDKLAVLVATVLASPDFLYLLELGDSRGTDTRFPLTQHEIANRLSYGMLGTMPPPALLAKADAAMLSDPAAIDAAGAELLASPAAHARAAEFFGWWLETSSLPGVPSNPAFLAGLATPGLRAEMLRELDEYVDTMVWTRKGTYRALMSSSESFARTPALQSIYGAGRKGLILRAPFLISTDDFTHPLPRGARLRKRVLCDVLGLPSPEAQGAINEILDPQAVRDASGRDRYAAKTSAAQCAGCHALINPLGFALEGYDSAARVRSTEVSYAGDGSQLAEHALNTNVENLRVDRTAAESASGADDLVELIAGSDKGALCLARQVHRFYRLQNEDLSADACELRDVQQAMSQGSIVDGLRIHAARWAVTDKVVHP